MRRPPRAWVIAALGAVAYLVLDPPSSDLAAQEYRVALFERAGFALWNNGWYAGHHTPAYSLLFPPLGAALGARAAGALAAVAAAALFERLARRRWGERAGWGAAWFGAAMALHLLTGRLAFTLGVAAGLGALLALQARRPLPAVVLGAATTLCSPVAGLFLTLAATVIGLAAEPGHARARSATNERFCPHTEQDRSFVRTPRAMALGTAAAAAATGVVLVVLFPEGGTEPFVASAFWPALVALGLVALVLPARERGLRLGVALYTAGCVAAFAIATPLGGNVTRLGALFAGPVLLCAAAGARRPVLLAALALPLAYWQVYPAVRDVARAGGDPAVEAAYYRPLLSFLETRPGTFRVEIPFTQNHWEAVHVSPRFPLARGWERQLDRKGAALFYDGALTPARYRRWLDSRAVRYVALPDATLDYAGRDEAALLERGVPWLRPVWSSRHWRVFELTDAAPLIEGAGRRIELGDDEFGFEAHRPGDVLVRVHHTRWWRVTAGAACVASGPDGMTRVRVRRAGAVRIAARLTGSRCRG